MSPVKVTKINVEKDPDKRIRMTWADCLREQMDSWFDPSTGEQGMSRKQLQRRLAEIGIDVSLQSISMWLSAQTSPRPSVQVAIGRVFNVNARFLFPLEVA